MTFIQLAFLWAPPLAAVICGLIAQSAARAALWAALATSAIVGILVGYSIFVAGQRGVPPAALAAGSAITAALAWVTFWLRTIFRSERPSVTAWRFDLLLLAASIVLFAVLIVVRIDLYDETPEMVYYGLKDGIHWLYLCVAAAIAIVLFASIAYTRPRKGRPAGALRLALLRVVPLTVVAMLLLPIAMAVFAVQLSVSLLDCAPRSIPGYVPHMVDYTRLVFDNLMKGLTFGSAPLWGFNLATCTFNRDSVVASCIVWALRLLPSGTLLWLALRSYRISTKRSAAPLASGR